jgi:hypothetical protein
VFVIFIIINLKTPKHVKAIICNLCGKSSWRGD